MRAMMVQKAKPTKAKPDPVVEALQRELKQQGFFPYEIDGKAGEKTTQAVASRDAALAKKREEDLAAKQAETARIQAEAAAKTAGAQADATATETARKQRYQEQASSGMGMATQSAANLAAPALGTALGMQIGKGVNAMADASQANKNQVLQAAARDRLAGITTREGAREGARLAGAMPIDNTLARTASRMAPHLGLGAVAMGKGAQVLHESDPNSEFYPAMADRAAGLGYIGTGAGLAKQGLRYAFSPGVSPDAQSIAIINSNQLRRSPLTAALESQAAAGAPDMAGTALPAPGASAPATEPPQRQRRVSLAKAAQAAGAPSGLNKAQAAEYLAKNLTDENRGKVAKALGVTNGPNLTARVSEAVKTMASKKGLSSFMAGTGPAAGIAAGLAFAATPDEAMAADGSSRGGVSEGLTNAAAAGGVAAGTSKLAQALGPVAGMMGEASAPGMIDAMTDDFASAEARNFAARHLPEFMQFGAVDQARQMATVPQANPARVEGQGGYGANIENRIRRMVQTGADPNQIAAFLNSAMPQ